MSAQMQEQIETRIQDTLQALKARCAALGITPNWNGAISESELEKVLGYSSGAFRNKRSEGKVPPHHKRGRAWYFLKDVAIWWESGRIDP